MAQGTLEPVAAMLTGRCANGAERDRGRLVHLLPEPGHWGKALCGAKPGRLSGAGWDMGEDRELGEITCKRCLKKAGG